MLSIAAMGSGGAGYYTSLASEDYYIEGGEPPGLFWGRQVCEELGLLHLVSKEALGQILDGRATDGRPLVQAQDGRDHQPGWDLTFSAPKSVSVLWAMASPETRTIIQDAQRAAVERALQYLEGAAGFTRRGKAGHRMERVRLLAALFEHGTSRAEDPQLHTHALVPNVGLRRDGTFGTLWSRGFYLHKRAAGAIYRAELAHLLVERLGLRLTADKNSFGIHGVPKDLIRLFSKRREAILRKLEDEGLEGGRAAAFAALETRGRKSLVARDLLFSRWRAIGEEYGFGVREAEALRCMGVGVAVGRVVAKVREAIADATYHESTFFLRDLVRLLAERLESEGVAVAEVLEFAREALRSGEVVKLRKQEGYRLYTTVDMLAYEDRLSIIARTPSRDVRHRVAEDSLLEVPGNRSLSDEQGKALRHLVATEDGLALVSGLAGTGKTRLQAVARELWEGEGKVVLGAALSAKAAFELEQGAGIQSRTLDALLLRLDKEPRFLGPNAVVVLDEAGMVGTRKMVRLLEHVRRTGAKAVLVGDERQLPPIEAGAPFRWLREHLGAAELVDVRRQRESWMRDVVRDLAGGRAEEALRALSGHGRLHVVRGRGALVRDLVATWEKATKEGLDENLVLASTRAEVAMLNQRLQEARVVRGEVTGARMCVGEAELCVGDRVMFRRNDRFLGVRNGEFGVVEAVGLGGEGAQVRVAMDGGARAVVVDSGMYSDLELGYSVTTHKAQGATVESVQVLVGEEAASLALGYVQASRARGCTFLFVGDEAASGLWRRWETQARKGMAREMV